MKKTALRALLFALGASGFIAAQAQDNTINVVTTAVPFLRVSPDARSGGMGDLGVATSPDAAAGLWNIGKVAFNQSNAGAHVSYTPWLKDIVSDVFLFSGGGYYKIDEDQALNLGVRYFNLGNIQFTDMNGNLQGNGRPRELGLDVGYSRKLSERLGLGVSLRYINSALATGASGGNTYKPGNAVAGDIGLYYDATDEGNGFTFGTVFSNLGSKISYTDNADRRDFIPANWGLGATWNKLINEENKIMFGLDVNKLLVPALKSPATQEEVDEYYTKGLISSWGSSFSDMPGQASVSIGGEYVYNDQFSLRAGYFWEDKKRGNRQYATVGVGLRYSVFNINMSYLVPSGSGVTRNPLSNTLRFSMLFDLGSQD